LLKSNLPDPKPRKRFAYKKVNLLWQGDLMYSVYLKDGKKKRQTYLIAFIDDATRVITGAQFSFSQNFEALRKVIVSALITRGLPSIIYVDNGKIYRSQRLQLGCATLGISLVNTKPYDP
jgi:transposase InsO family protein